MKREHVVLVAAAVVAALLAAALATDSAALWRLISMLGEETMYVALSLAVYVAVSTDLGVALLLGVLLSGAVNIGLKYSFRLPRPPKALWRAEAEGYGFPSGHTQVSSAFWSQAAVTSKSRSVAILGAVAVTSIALSRLALRVHYLHDVLGGAAIGVALGVGLALLYAKRPGLFYPATAGAAAVLGLAEGLAFGFTTAYKIAGLALGILAYPAARSKVSGISRLSAALKAVAYLVLFAATLAITRGLGRLAHGPLVAAVYLLAFLVILGVSAAFAALAGRRAGA